MFILNHIHLLVRCGFEFVLIQNHIHLWLQVWDFESVDMAEVTNDKDCFEMEPRNELKVGNDV